MFPLFLSATNTDVLMKRVNPIFISLLLIWIVFVLNSQMSFNMNYYGIIPRYSIGLRGIILAPFLHGNLIHISSNSIPFLILGSTLFLYYKNTAWQTYIFSVLITGILIWLFARPAIHIGMSGVIYSFATYLTFAGIFSRRFWGIVISILTLALYGSLVWGVMPTEEYISWEAHLSGVIAGAILAYTHRKKLRRK